MSARFITYQVLIEIDRAVRVRVGKLGVFGFPAGHYIYTGSARRSLDARVRRHFAAGKRLHWHIDHLLAAPGVRPLAAKKSRRGECAANQAVHGAILAPGFGASDCRAGCGSHLKYVGR